MRTIGEVWKDYTGEYKIELKDHDALRVLRLAFELVVWNTTSIRLMPFLLILSMILGILFIAGQGMLEPSVTE